MLLFLIFALLAGVVLPVQAGVNAQLRATLGNPLAAALVSFVVGTVGLLGLVAVVRVPLPVVTAWGRSPGWHWIGGLLGAGYVAIATVLAPRLGAATLVAAVVAGQMLTSVVLDQYGLVGYAPHPLTAARALGVVLVIGGVILIQR
jgi:transporter family-2 protein